jgi:hypothetical protein
MAAFGVAGQTRSTGPVADLIAEHGTFALHTAPASAFLAAAPSALPEDHPHVALSSRGAAAVVRDLVTAPPGRALAVVAVPDLTWRVLEWLADPQGAPHRAALAEVGPRLPETSGAAGGDETGTAPTTTATQPSTSSSSGEPRDAPLATTPTLASLFLARALPPLRALVKSDMRCASEDAARIVERFALAESRVRLARAAHTLACGGSMHVVSHAAGVDPGLYDDLARAMIADGCSSSSSSPHAVQSALDAAYGSHPAHLVSPVTQRRMWPATVARCMLGTMLDPPPLVATETTARSAAPYPPGLSRPAVGQAVQTIAADLYKTVLVAAAAAARTEGGGIISAVCAEGTYLCVAELPDDPAHRARFAHDLGTAVDATLAVYGVRADVVL